jgi:phosphatidylserine/phosphatidylglycerophosphate/cardiolipin synthase-like enzyme/uncharacterized membrane protein YdjX (TVP38/TMEM64 family)
MTEVARGGFLMSGREYFRAFRKAVLQAERTVYILAWDLSEKIETVRDPEDDDGFPSRLADFVFAVLDAKPKLHIYVLLWDYSMVYAAEREWLPFTRWRQENHPRLHFELDDAINVGASHHQKMVVVDEAVAFFGGFDLSAWRWDTTEHAAQDERRRTPKDELYQPFHDMQLVTTGPIVGDLSELFAMRWERATGEELPRIDATRDAQPVPWPEGTAADFREETAALSLTFSRFKTYEPSRQVEQLHLDIIREARKYIYIENQYFSSHTIAKALIDRLDEEDGPEVVIVLTRDTGGWIEEGTMGVLRDRLLELMAEADRRGRFAAYHPFVEDEAGHATQVYVHAKLLIADDRILATGSANLSNRSMKVDSELDLAVVRPEPAEYIRVLLARLIGIHFRTSASEVKTLLDDSDSLIGVIESLRDGSLHRLEPLEAGANNPIQRKLADTQLLDPDEPISPAYWLRDLLRRQKEAEDTRGAASGSNLALKVMGGVVVGVILIYLLNKAWGEVLDREQLIRYFESFRNSPVAIPTLFAVFFVAGLVGISINVLLVAGTIVMGPIATFACGLLGSLASAAIAFGIGDKAGKPLIKRVVGQRLDSLSEKIGSRGVLSVALIRVVPIAPFVVINFIAGFSHLRFATFMKGSILGMVPGMLAVVLATEQVRLALADPNWKRWLGVIVLIGLIAAAFYYLKRKSEDS